MTSSAARPLPERTSVERLADTVLPTRHGTFRMTAYRDDVGEEHVVLSVGITDAGAGRQDLGRAPLVRVHSECLTGDALGSLRCDCGEQLQRALHLIMQDGYGALVYVGGHEGRGIGLVEKVRAYALQDTGVDTVDANLRLGHQADQRTYGQTAAILEDLGITEIRLLSSNPAKQHALTALDVRVVTRHPLVMAGRPENAAYLRTKRERMGHDREPLEEWPALLRGEVTTGPLGERYAELVRPGGPQVLAQLGQSLDGFIASRTGDAAFVTGEADREHLHRLRALVDAVVVGAATVVADDPQLTVRAVEGQHATRVVLDPRGTVPRSARVLTDGVAPTLWVVGEGVQVGAVASHVEVLTWPGSGSMDPAGVLAMLHERGLARVLVEGGGRLVTAFVEAGVVDRLYLTTAPVLIGEGVPGLRPAGTDRLADALRPPVVRRWFAGEDVVTELDLTAARAATSPTGAADGPGRA